MENKKIYLGKNNRLNVYFNLEATLNKHIIIFGKTGSGKSVQAQNIVLDIARNGGTVVVLDVHSVFSKEHIFHVYREELEMYLHEINVYDDGICCDFFAPVMFADGTFEKTCDTAGAVVDILARTTNMGIKQKSILRRAVEEVIDKGLFKAHGIKALDRQLTHDGTYAEKCVRDKIYPFIIHNIFRSGNSFIKQGKVNVVRLEKFNLSTQEIIAELVLSYLWRMASVSSFKENGLFVFVDEFHNLISGKKCALKQIIAEGRKFNLNLILATQQFPSSIQHTAQDFMQSGLILLFKPCSDQIDMVAKFIDFDNKKEWRKILKSLKQGEFIAVGELVLNNFQCIKPLKITNEM